MKAEGDPMLTKEMQARVVKQRLGFVATVSATGEPNVSPKGTFVVVDDRTLAFGEIRSPGTIANIATARSWKSTSSTRSAAKAFALRERPRPMAGTQTLIARVAGVSTAGTR
jgi:predicted pyridoxine 5'-phosphate oxidase superfamily flavin-nucleotide-binding protein